MQLTPQPPNDRTPPTHEPALSRYVRRWYDRAQELAGQGAPADPAGGGLGQQGDPTDPGPRSRPGRPRVLLATSNWAEISALQLVLGPVSDTTVARSQDEALRWLDQTEFDVVLWDLELDGADPRALQEQLEHHRRVFLERVVFLEPRKPTVASRWLVERAAHTVLHRPLAPRQLLQAVARICSRTGA